MLWDSNLPIQEYSDTHVYTTIYDQGSFKPVARLAWLRDDLPEVANDARENDKGWYGNDKPADKTGIQVYHHHNDQLGTPNELTDSHGKVIWLADYEAWGNTAKVIYNSVKINQVQVSQNELQPIRFQGQHFDEETGLHYNRFRYYDPDVGMFTTRDPIGLLGDLNVFAYAPNPTGWTDSLGLHPAAAGALSALAAAGRALIGSGAKTSRRVIGKVAGEVASAEEQSCTSVNCEKKCLPATEVNIRTVLSPTNEKTIQKSVSSPVIQAYVNMIEMGQTSMPPIQMSGNTIVNGNHRFIAAKLCKMDAPKTQWNMSPSDANKAYPIRNINIDSFDWGNR